MAKRKTEGYLSAKESRRISKENRRATALFEKKRKRKNVAEAEYTTAMKDPANAVEFDIVALLPDTGERYLSTQLYAFEEYPL